MEVQFLLKPAFNDTFLTQSLTGLSFFLPTGFSGGGRPGNGASLLYLASVLLLSCIGVAHCNIRTLFSPSQIALLLVFNSSTYYHQKLFNYNTYLVALPYSTYP